MDNSLVVFQENDLYFGLYPNEFKSSFTLNHVWISNTGEDSPVWQFTRTKDPLEGVFIHFGSLLGLSQAHFDNGGYIFIKEAPSIPADVGICVSGLLMKIPIKSLRGKKTEIDDYPRFPDSIPRTIFRFVQQYKGKPIFVIDPLLLFRAFDIATYLPKPTD